MQCFCPRTTQKEDAMDSLPQPGARNWTPRLCQTRLHSRERIRESHWEAWKALSHCRVKRLSLCRWFKRYDGLGEDGLREQGTRWMKRYNSTPRMALGLRTPDQVEFAELRDLMITTGVIRCPKLGRRLTSPDN